MPEYIDRTEGRKLFGLDPRGYDDSRPEYPSWIYERLRDTGALREGATTLEIGAGGGRATRELLKFGAGPLTILEPDSRFAPLLESIADEYDADCSLIQQSFEEVDLPPCQFDLVAAATSFHWIEQGTGLQKVRRLLKKAGVAALFWNVFQVLDKEDRFHAATEGLLSNLAVSPSGAPKTIPFALDRQAREADMHASGFNNVEYVESRWTLVLDTDQVGKLYAGFSHIQRLDDRSRATVLHDLMEIADTQFDGRVERNITSCLYVLT